MKRFFKTMAFTLLGLVLSVNLWAAEETYTFTSKSWGATNSASQTANWTSGKDGGQLTTNQGIQVSKNATGANGTSPISFTNVSKVVVKYCTNSSDGVGTIKVQIGSGTEKSFSITKPAKGTGTTLKDAEFTFSPAETGKIKITAECTTNSVYVYGVTITYSGDDPTPSKTLESIAISGTPTKTTYETGEEFDPVGLVVTGTYSDESEETLTDDAEWTVTPATFTLTSQTSVSVTAMVSGKSDTKNYDVTVTEHVVTPGTYEIVPNTTFFNVEEQTTGSHDAVTGKQNDITITHSGGSSFYCNASQVRTYKDNTLTFSVPTGYEITSIVLAVTNNASYSANVGTYTASTKTWAGNANEVVLTSGQSSGNYQITKITVTYAAPIKKSVTISSIDAATLKVNDQTGTISDVLKGTSMTLSYEQTEAQQHAYRFSAWDVTTEDGAVAVTDNTFEMPAKDVTVSATFEPLYAVSVATAGEGSGTATINGGTETIYVSEDDEITLVAEAAAGSEFGGWSTTDDILFDDETAANTTASTFGAGTITATFNKKQCTILGTPNVQVTDETYSSAKLTWDAVGNADYYMVFIPTVDIEEIVEGTQYEATGLSAKTQYTYQVIASSNNSDTYCDSNPAEGNFTTADYPAATLTLSENGVETPYSGSIKINTPFNLPDCSVECDKVFVGWSESNTDHSNLLAAGSSYTMTETTGTLYAWFATETPGEVTDVYTLSITKNNNSAYGSTYNITVLDIEWNVPGNQNIGDYVKLGGKLSSATDRALYSKNAISSNVDKVIANHGAKDAEITVNSIKLDVYSTAAKAETGGNGDISSISGTYAESGNTEFLRPSDANWTGRFYRLTYNLSSSQSGSNKGLILNTIKMQSAGASSYDNYSLTCSAKATAPEFSLTESTYTSAQTLTITAEQGATIYYTLDGSEPDNTKTQYTGAISLNTYGQVTIKAIAYVAEKDPSDVVTKEYMINLPFASLADLVAASEANKIPNNNATVTVTLTNIEIASFNGTKGVNLNVICENKNVQIYNSTAFDTDWKVGGTLSHSSLTCTWQRYENKGTYQCWELMPSNWEGFTYNDPVHITSIAISGQPTNKDYSAGQQLNPAGLVVTGTYSDSPEHTEVITEGLTWTLPTLAEGAITAKVTVKYTEPILSTPLTSEEYEVTINAVTPAKTLQSIYVADDSKHKTEFFVGRPFSSDGLKVMAKYNIGEDQPIVPTSVTPPAMTSAGTKQVTVSYTEGGVTAEPVTYDITLTYMNLNDLVAATDINDHDHVYVKFENVTINKVVSKGIYLDVQKDDKDIEIYCQSTNHSADWAQYGTVSATLDNVEWTYFTNGSVWELMISNWNAFTYNEPNIPVTSMEISPAAVSVKEGAMATLSINYTPDNATNKGVTWAVTAGSEFASVDAETGVVTGNKAGSATITATLTADPTITATRTVTVTETPKCTISYYVKGEVASTQEIAREKEGTLTYVPTLTVAGYTFAGWAEEAIIEESATATLITKYTPGAEETAKSVYAVFKRVDDSSPTYQQYAKVTSALTDWAGDYLIAYSDEIFANGQKGGKDDEGAIGKQYVIANPGEALSGNVVTKEWGDQYKVTLEEISAGSNTYVLKTQDGKYNYQTSNANGLNVTSTKSTAAAYPISVTFTSENDIKLALGGSASGAVFRYNTDQFFRYYKDGGQKAVYLYKYDAGSVMYTSNPVAKVKVTFNLDGGVGGCGTITVNEGEDAVLCEDAPTKDLYKFKAWSDGENEYAPSATIENVTEDIELTALWIAKQQYTISFNKGGAAGTTPASISDYEYNEVTLPAQGDLSNPGYIFGGWNDGEITYAGGATFTMPEKNVSMTAVWVAKTNDKWYLVTSAEQLATGKQYAVVANTKDMAMGAMVSGKTYMANVSASFNTDKSMMIAIDPSAVILTLGGNATDGWTLSNNGKFLGSETTKNMSWIETIGDKVGYKWTITIAGEEGDFEATMSPEGDYLKYNASDPRFTTYASGQTAVQLYVLVPAKAIDEEVDASTLDDHADVTVNEGGNLVINEDVELGDIVVMVGGTVTLEATTTLTVNNFVIKSTMGAGKSGQVLGVTSTNFVVEENAYFDVTLGDNGNPEKWHAFAVPFNVDAINGVYDLDDNKLTNEVNYAIMDYHGDVRAEGQYGWKKFRGIMQPGVFYLMTVDGERTTYRMKMNGGFSASSTTITVNEYASGTTTDAGWNGIANNQLNYSSIGVDVQVLNPTSYTFETMTASTYNFTVGTPFFYQASATGTIDLTAPNASENYAPRRVGAAEAKNIAISFANDTYTDRLYISATDAATNEYQIGRDLVKMTMTNAPAVPQIFAEAYGTKLSMIDVPMMNDEAVYALNLYAPANGEYTIGAAQVKGYEVFLTQYGSVIWNLSMSEATIELTKGNNTEYGLILKATSGHAPTDINTLNGQESVQKFFFNGNIYIRHNNKTYGVTGQLVK